MAGLVNHDIIRQAVLRMVAAAHAPQKVILFGSYGRGSMDDRSDLDLMVVEEEVPDPVLEYSRLREAVGDIGIGVDLVIYPRKEFEKRQSWCSSPVYWAVREGVVMFSLNQSSNF